MTQGVKKGETKQTDEERKAREKLRREKNRSKNKAYHKKYRENPENKVKGKKYRDRPEVKARKKIRDQSTAYREKAKAYYAKPENIVKKKAYAKKYDQKPEVKAKQKKYQQTPEYKASIKKYRDNPENIVKMKNTRDENRLIVLEEYSKRLSNSDIPCCNCCGLNKHLDFLAIDHITGRKEMDSEPELVKLGYSSKLRNMNLQKWLRDNNFPKGFQILCHNCNMTKGHSKDNKCPHERK